MRILLALCLVACSPPDRGPRFHGTGQTTPRNGGTLRFAANDHISDLDPVIAYDEISFIALHHIVDTLVDYPPATDTKSKVTDLVPRLAESWTISPDGLTYSFRLRPGLRYADGMPIVAEDFKRALDRALAIPEPKFAGFLADVVGAQDVVGGKRTECAGITTIGDDQLVIRLAHPNAAFLYVFTMTFTSPLSLEYSKHDDLRTRPQASGPYEIVEWEENQRLVLRRRANYYDPARQHLDGITLFESVPRDTQFLMFQLGELDVAERLGSPDYLWIKAQPAWAPYVHSRPIMNAYGSRMNVTKWPFTDKRVRQAMNYAVDKSHIVKLLNGIATPAHGMLAPGSFGRDDTLAPYPHDPAKARALLREAGHPHGFDIEYVTLVEDDAEKLAAALQQDLAEVGVRMQISRMTLQTYQAAVARPDGPAFSYYGWIADFPDPTSFLDQNFHARAIESGTNNSFYANPELDKLLDGARGELDVAKRETMYHQAEQILFDDAPWIWGYHQSMTEVTQPYVRGYELHPIWLRDYTNTWLDGPLDRP